MSKKLRSETDHYAYKLGHKERDTPKAAPSYGQLRHALNHLVSENERLRRRVDMLVVEQAEMKDDIKELLRIAEHFCARFATSQSGVHVRKHLREITQKSH